VNIRSFFPFTLRRILKRRAGIPDTWNSLIRLKKIHHFNPKIIFDVGAYKGEWTKMCLKIYPQSKFFLFEPQNHLKKELNSLQNKNIIYENILIADQDNREVNFYEFNTSSSVLKFGKNIPSVKKTTKSLDTYIKENKIKAIDILKIDVQGYELNVLMGAISSLKIIEVLIIEVSFLEIYEKSPLAIRIIEFLDKNNFQIFDVVDFKYRPLDNNLFQVDMFFINKKSKIINDKRYSL
tara:strand:- start:474 stop:1184 length:711 start_codon:yes stop_codon:yes gene_type:complete